MMILKHSGQAPRPFPHLLHAMSACEINRVDYSYSTPPFHMILRKFQLSCADIRPPKMRLE